MTLQIDEVLAEITDQSAVGDVPELDGAVLGATGDDVVVERVPLDVQHLPAVSAHLAKTKNFVILGRDSKVREKYYSYARTLCADVHTRAMGG